MSSAAAATNASRHVEFPQDGSEAGRAAGRDAPRTPRAPKKPRMSRITRIFCYRLSSTLEIPALKSRESLQLPDTKNTQDMFGR